MNKRIKPLVATLVTTASLAGFGKEIYSNDFATRSSHKDMPGSQWYEMTYATTCPAPLCYHYGNSLTTYTPMSAYKDLTKMQDGWTLAVGPETRRYVDFAIRKMDGSDNPCASAYNISGQDGQFGSGLAIQPLYNVFSNGRLRISADLKAPATLGSGSDANFRVMLLRDRANPPSTYTLGPAALSFGIMEDCHTLRAVGDSNWGYSTRIPDSGNVDKTHWWRFVIDCNLDANTYVLTVYDMGTTQPTLATPTPTTPYGTAANGHLISTATAGSITALGLQSVYATYRTVTSDTTADLCPSYDNIRIWWRTDDGAFDASNLFYENDFATRRVRTLMTLGSTADYSSSLVPTNAETYVFGEGYATSVANDTSNLAPATSGKTTGRDDWLQISYSSSNCGKIYSSGEAGRNVLAAILKPSPSAYYARVNHPIGTTIDSAYVKVEYDLRTMKEWGNYGNGSWVAYLGLDDSNGFPGNVRFGISTDTWPNRGKFFPYYKGSGTPLKVTSTSLTASSWYRFRIVANRSTGKLSLAMYALDSSSGSLNRAVPEDPVFTVDDVAFDGTKAITHYSFSGYDIGSTYALAPLLDNVRIWTGEDGSNWNLVYQNDFNKRVRYGQRTVEEAKMLAKDIDRVGLDGWIRRGAGTGDMYIRNAANPYVTVESESSFAHAVHTLKPVKKGKITVRADIRPPSRMTDKADYPGCVYIGGDEYAQGQIGQQSSLRTFTDAAFGCFGFARSGSIEKMDFYNHAVLFAKGGAGEVLDTASADLTSWYRFVATFDLDAKTWRVDVYNQGTVQPTADSADGTLVKSFEDLTFVNDDPSGFSAIGIAGGGTTGDKPLEVDKRSVLFDNIKVTGDDFGMLMLLK